MRSTTSYTRILAVLAIGTVATAGLAGCAGASGSNSASSGASSTYTLWDPYPDRDASSDWAKVIDACASELKITIDRNAGNTGDTVKDLTTAAPNLPDIALVDNPKVSTLAEAGLLTTTADNGLDVSGIEPNILSAGQMNGKTYGVPVGANTLGLYYNPTVLAAAGVDISSVTDQASLTNALTKVVAAGKKGITFSAVGTEEGSFQFLPWFWGSGAELTKLDSAAGVGSLQLWTDWVKTGLAPNSVLQNTQGTSWDEFLTGEYAFAENGSWFKSAADKAGYASMQIPSLAGGAAPAPTGGEFITIPIQKDTSRYAMSIAITKCLTTGNKAADALGYIAPTAAGQKAQVEADPTLQGWVTAVGDAKTRTGDDLGTNYPIISEQLFTAVQNALSGASSPSDALTKAQSDAAAKLK